jgi:hypothetical protein
MGKTGPSHYVTPDTVPSAPGRFIIGRRLPPEVRVPMRQVLPLFMLLTVPVAGCGRDRQDTGESGTASASPYTAGSERAAREDGLEGTNTGTELEAPRLIPALRNQLELMSTGSRVNNDNLTAYKNLAQDVTNSMVADLYRAGYADTGTFRSLKDSVLDDIGGGGASEHDLDRSEIPQHVRRMRQLIDRYQQAMRSAADKL